jgi:hypothetical protein
MSNGCAVGAQEPFWMQLAASLTLLLLLLHKVVKKSYGHMTRLATIITKDFKTVAQNIIYKNLADDRKTLNTEYHKDDEM